MPQLSVVVLCYRGEEHIIPYITQIKKALEQKHLQYELVLVANYDLPITRDRTPEIARALAQKDARNICVATQKSGMMGWDLRQGLAHATGRAIAFIDGDGQTPASDILKLYDLLIAEQLDICKVYRIKRADAPFRKVVSAIFNFAFWIFFPGHRIRDINAKPKMITRAALEKMQLTSDDWFIDAEMMLETRRLKLKFLEIPGVAGENTWRKSFIGVSAVIEFAKNLLAYRIRYFFLR